MPREDFTDLDDDDDRPRRRSRRDDNDYYDERDDYDDAPYPQLDARQRVVGPGRALLITGLIGMVLSVIGGVFLFLMVVNAPNANQQGDENVFMGVLLGGSALLSAAYFGVITLGGKRMAECRSYGLAMTAAILCIASIVCIGILSVVMIPFGIWAMVVLSDAKVKRAFEGPRRRSHEDDYDDDRWR